MIALDPLAAACEQYVVSFGKDAALGCFTAPEPIALRRGDAVLLKTPRGIEVGEVLCPASIRQARLLGAQVRGDLLRRLADDDRTRSTDLESRGRMLLDAAHALSAEQDLNLIVLDAEVLFDGRQAMLQVLHPNPDELAGFVHALSARVGLEVRLTNLAQPLPADEPEVSGCGKPDCGSGGGGCTSCSTGGGCSSCGPPGGVDVRPYFAHLRAQMEASNRVPLL